MTKPQTEVKKALVSLIQKSHGKITHAEARETLKGMGFEIAPEPTEKSEDYRTFEKVRDGYEKPDWKDEASLQGWYDSIFAECGFSPEVARKVRKDFEKIHHPFEKERNNFHVYKSMHGKAPKRSKTEGKAKVKAKGRRGRPTSRPVSFTSTAASVSVLEKAKSLGGVNAINARIAELQKEMTELQEVLNGIESVQNDLAAVA